MSRAPRHSIPLKSGELIVGKRKGRSSPDQITLFRSLGLAVEDLAAGEFVLEKVETSG